MAEATRAMVLMPPMMTRKSSTASTSPLAHCGMSNEALRPLARLALCGMLPEPSVLSTVATANSTASHFMFSPRSMKYMGPPAISPLSSFTRYLWESATSTNLVVMPRNAVIHIQNSAAGPPRKMAKATPAMLPVPTVPERAVESAWKCEVSPSASRRVWRPRSTPQARLK